MKKDERIFITGANGMIGQAQLRYFKAKGFSTLDEVDVKLDLLDQKAVDDFFRKEKPAYVFVNSIKVGGIYANSQFPADFIYENITSQTNVIHAAWQTGAKKLLYLASSCIYPKESAQPIREDYIMAGALEPTSAPYAIAKIAGIKMCQSYRKQYGADFITAVPADAYGPGDDFNPETGHVLAALISRINRAKNNNEPELVVWGTGKPRRETLFIDDLADACHFLMENYDGEDLINVGSGADISIGQMAETVKVVIGYKGDIKFNTSRPDGMMRKLLDTTRLEKLGWKPKIKLIEGLKMTYETLKS